ncbi:SDR family oxidoreductase [Synechococcus sp. AH-551-E05]|nr:SDR family oxidoreductase [Synechococcus sp. AH-551-E05]MDB4650982.1 SDR family oxidoreductase [Synechococcus sp. AH-551-E05]
MLSALVKRCRPLPTHAQLLVLGGGYSGRCFAQLARELGAPVLSTRRQADRPGADLVFDSTRGLLPSPEALQGVTHLLSTIPPSKGGGDPVLSCLLPLLKRLSLQWAGYLSTTGVYGNRNGGWVQETDLPDPGLDRSRRRLECEQAWLNSGLPVQILRLPGIYGPGRSVLDSLRQGKARVINKPGQVFCRIHVEDIAGACWHLIQHSEIDNRPSVINVVDDEPAAPADLVRHAATLLNCELPKEEQYDTICADMSPMAQSFWSENRRVSNHRLRHDLGYQLMHPTYREGLQDCLEQDRLNLL